MRNIFIGVAIAALVLFIILYLAQIHRLRSGNQRPLGSIRVFINWVLLLLIIAGAAGAVYTTANPTAFGGNSSKQTKADDSYQVTNKSTATSGTVSWSPKTIRLNSDSEAKITFNVPKNTKVRILGHRTGTVYQVLKSKSTAYTKVVKLSDAGKYDVEITRADGTEVNKKLVVHEHKKAASSSSSNSSDNSSTSSSSSSASSSRSSSASRSNNNNNSNNSGSSRSNNSGSSTGSSRSTGGYSGGGSSYRYNGGGSSYRPSYSGGGSSTSTNSGSSSVYNGRGYAPAAQ